MFPKLRDLAAAALPVCQQDHWLTKRLYADVFADELQVVEIERPSTELHVNGPLTISPLAYGVGCFVSLNEDVTYLFPHCEYHFHSKTISNMCQDDVTMFIQVYIRSRVVSGDDFLKSTDLHLFPMTEAVTLRLQQATVLRCAEYSSVVKRTIRIIPLNDISVTCVETSISEDLWFSKSADEE